MTVEQGRLEAMNLTGGEHPPLSTSEDDPVARIERELTVIVRRAEAAVANQPEAERLTRSGYSLLIQLERASPLGIAALADAAQIDVSTASRQIVPLERQGLVQRLSNPVDGRGSLVEITQIGLERLRQTRASRYTTFLDLLHDWSPEDRVAFAAYLQRLNEALARQDAARIAGKTE